MENQKQHIDVYELVNNRIIELLEAGTVPWQKPWTAGGIPRNLLSLRPYQGVNILLLSSLPYTHNLFLTFKQIKSCGGSVIKGEKGHLIVFTKMVEVEERGEMKKKFFLRFYRVFNIEQCTGLRPELIPKEGTVYEKNTTCEAVVLDMPNPPSLKHGGKEACYVPSTDTVHMPPIKTFKGAEPYYSVLFHELVHATGHATRLNRKEVTEKIVYGSESYSLEELTAEIGACYLKSYSGINYNNLEQSASYINNWLEVLRHDKKFIIHASVRAQKAVNHILGITIDSKDKNHENTNDLTSEVEDEPVSDLEEVDDLAF